MKETLFKILISLFGVGGVGFFVWQSYRATEERQAREAKEWNWKMHDYWQKGFFAGAKAVTQVMTPDTNTGKWVLELTNLLHEMDKEENGTNWSSH
jgi:hypothetical protein